MSSGGERRDRLPVAPVIYPREFRRFLALCLEERQEAGLGLDTYDAVVLEPYAIDDEAQEQAPCMRVGLGAPERGEVFEHATGLV